MRNIYIYLSWTGWIWFLIAFTYLGIRNKKSVRRWLVQTIQSARTKRIELRSGFPVILIADKTKTSTEAKKSE